ncbi:alpha/beta fold hydrolase [Streptomyces sp. NPDC048566]|uniref:alpha/beta fold hydrolase n=1 Tax=Streptomyces sp. NPDC048566 TaxID=3365569 RepID=UPI0037111190
MTSLALGDTEIRYDDSGPAAGLPVLLIHGHPFDRTLWAPQVAALVTAGYRVVTPDLRGYGGSGVREGVVRLGDFADDLVALLDHLGIGRAVVGGVSMGGQIAMEMQRGHGERVRALVLSDTSAPAETDEGRAARHRMADRLLAEGMGGYAEEVIGRMIAPYNVTAMPAVAEHVLGMMRRTDPRGAAAALRGRAERPDYRDTLAAVRCPVLVLVGADDSFTPVADAEALRALVPHAVLSVIPGAGHLPGAEQPGLFNAALLEFLAGRVAVTGA